MSEGKVQKQQGHEQEKQQPQAVKLRVDLPDIITETYAKAYLAYRISLENWFLLNEILAFIKNEKLSAKEVQSRLQKLFSVINTEIVEELVKLNQVALVKTARAEMAEEEVKEKEVKEENNG
jgi:E3 ubiquitin-protein ligase DOA10